ncbi:Uncharacterised protein [Mycobacteroides abscessus subsp. massiliense]|nr:Uncharacterised protein [Mycobacteroides abscessus subsp. abscessus]SKG48789.1 Uncharacterised protein [Mycobacteroides abscessus subsp. massiliense]SKH00147.1 Uncharacterised protein [Mycobacteroides abscessus subsp. massiliense]SKH98147.1 Uncharacterised protein [Mycobacteroides abscessus subsp. massiliense]SKJ27391.1 Uncharacterised protein [Mycobacteroides abscessus subsp. massiliense]
MSAASAAGPESVPSAWSSWSVRVRSPAERPQVLRRDPGHRGGQAAGTERVDELGEVGVLHPHAVRGAVVAPVPALQYEAEVVAGLLGLVGHVVQPVNQAADSVGGGQCAHEVSAFRFARSTAR